MPKRATKRRAADAIDLLILDGPEMKEMSAGLKFRLDLRDLSGSLGRADSLPPSAPVPLEAFDLRELLKLAASENERADKAEDRVDLYIESVNEIHRLVVAYELAHRKDLNRNEKLRELLKDIKSECASIKAPAMQPVVAGR